MQASRTIYLFDLQPIGSLALSRGDAIRKEPNMNHELAVRAFEYAAYAGLLGIAVLQMHWVWPLAMLRLL